MPELESPADNNGDQDPCVNDIGEYTGNIDEDINLIIYQCQTERQELEVCKDMPELELPADNGDQDPCVNDIGKYTENIDEDINLIIHQCRLVPSSLSRLLIIVTKILVSMTSENILEIDEDINLIICQCQTECQELEVCKDMPDLLKRCIHQRTI